MKSTEILQVLNLTKSKETTGYCSKLANLFEFIKMVKDTLIEAAIVENDLTIDSRGKLVDFKTVEADYKESLLNHYRYNDKQVAAITKKECELRCQKNTVIDLLWKKRKNKDNSVLQSEKESIETELQKLDSQKESLIGIEKNRLQSIVTDIVEMRKELNLLTGCKVLVETKQGIYSFYLPVDNAFYYTICRLLNVEFTVKDVVKKEAKYKFITYHNLLDNIKKAAGFVSNDDLRPAMQCICLDFSKEGLQIAATDAHKLYYSKNIGFEQYNDFKWVDYVEDLQILIAPESIKPLCRLKLKDSEPLIITVFNDNTASFNDFEVNVLPDTRYPQYKVVIPQYDNYMEFDKAELIRNVKKVMPFANKSTNQVNFHINGSIALSACDVDFAFESDADMPYITKQFPDTDIAFNGSFLVNCLGIFKDKTVKMLTDGKSTQAGIFTNDNDSVLLMPLMLNS